MICAGCGNIISRCTCARRNVEIADAIGFLYDTDTSAWYNRSCQLCSDADAGFAAYYYGIACDTLTSAEMRDGWQQAAGLDGYTSAMMAYVEETPGYAERIGWWV